ncbi:hypothetical protein [Bartonella koehlerae]|uniref:hypothetical protein n=1 Tax=Bartonella koehlerae TaxID=92181 RepID=UPI001ABB8D77
MGALYPNMFSGFLEYSLAGQALRRWIWALDAKQMNDFPLSKHSGLYDIPDDVNLVRLLG